MSTYGKLAGLVVLILSEPMIMDRYGEISPVIVNNQAWRERLRRTPGAGPLPPDLQTWAHAAPPGETTWEPYAAHAALADAAPEELPDRSIYDTARRIMRRFRQ